MNKNDSQLSAGNFPFPNDTKNIPDTRNLRSQGKNELGSRRDLEKRKDDAFKKNARRSGRDEKTEDSERIMMTRCFTTSVRGSITTQAGVSVKAGRLIRLSTFSSSLFYSCTIFLLLTLVLLYSS